MEKRLADTRKPAIRSGCSPPVRLKFVSVNEAMSTDLAPSLKSMKLPNEVGDSVKPFLMFRSQIMTN